MQIDPGVYLVASGQLGFNMTDPYDCNIYLFDAGDSYVMFDAGAGMGINRMVEIFEQDGLNTNRVEHLFLTHAHTDHGGGAAHVRDHMPVEIYAAPRTAEIVEAGDEDAVSLTPAKESGLYPPDYVYRATKVDHRVKPGEPVTVGQLTMQLIETPGHSHDHCSYLVTTPNKRYLLSGDAIFFGGKIILQHTYDCSVPQSLDSILHLSTFEFDALLPGHLVFSLRDGRKHVDSACALIHEFRCPESIV